jgi:tetratricopeptide (TPR) repeat protein
VSLTKETRTSRRRRPAGRRWNAVDFAFTAIAGAGAAGRPSLWDDPAFLLYREGVEALDRGDPITALRHANEAIHRYPRFVLAHYLRGQAALAAGRRDDAIGAFAAVVDLYPESAAARAALARLLGRRSREERVAET